MNSMALAFNWRWIFFGTVGNGWPMISRNRSLVWIRSMMSASGWEILQSANGHGVIVVLTSSPLEEPTTTS